MFRFFRKHRSFVMVALAACIVGVILFGIGTPSLTATPQDTVMKVNGQKVTQMDFDRIYNQLIRQRQTATTPEQRQQIQGQALNELIREEVFFQEAKKYGIQVTDQALQMQLGSIPAFQKDGHFDPATYVRAVNQAFQMTPHDFEKMHKRDIASRQLNQLIASAVNISDEQFQQALEARLKTETDPKVKKEMIDHPEKFRQEIQDKEVNLVFSDWLNQLNSTLKVNMVSDTFRKRLAAPAQ